MKDSIAKTFERRAEPAQRRGPHRRLGDQVMEDALGRESRRAARRCGCRRPAESDDFGSGRRGWRVRQRLGGEQVAAAARAAGVPAAPDLGGPVGRPLRAVERGADRHHHRRADRLEAEFLLAPPAHPDRLARPAQRDDRRVGRRIVGAVVAVAARPLHVLAPRSPPDRASRSAPAQRAAGRRPANASTP